MQYTEYELSDEHMRGLIGDATAHPVLRKVRKDHFEAWLAEHDRRVKAEVWDAVGSALQTPSGTISAPEYRRQVIQFIQDWKPKEDQ